MALWVTYGGVGQGRTGRARLGRPAHGPCLYLVVGCLNLTAAWFDATGAFPCRFLIALTEPVWKRWLSAGVAGGRNSPLYFAVPLHAGARDSCAPLWCCGLLIAVSRRGGQGLRPLGNQPIGPACTRWLFAYFLTAAWFDTTGAFSCPFMIALTEPVWESLLSAGVAEAAIARCTLLVTLCARARDSYAPLLLIIYRGAPMTLWIASRSARSERTEPISLGEQPIDPPWTQRWATHMPPCMSSFPCLILNAAWFGTTGAFAKEGRNTLHKTI